MYPLKPRILIAGLGSLLFLTACNAQDASSAAKAGVPAGAVAVVNGTPITQARFDFLLKQATAQGQPDTAELRKSIRENLIVQEMAAQEAAKKGLDKDPEVANQLDMARQNVLVRAYLQDYIKAHPIGDDVLKAEYDKIKAQMGDKEYKARHILVDNEAEAKAIIAQLKKGAKFEKLASEKSKDPGSKANGGDLGWNSPATFVKPFADAMVKLQKGQYTTEPVQTPFGWHVIKVEDSRPLKAPPFEQVKNNLAQRMQQQQVEKAVADLKAKAKVEEASAAPAEKK
jgi:peptidyl-prolyl cis-trans isomerase C